MSAREEDQIQEEDELPEWAEIQRKTFTRWCNQQLKPRNLHLENLDTGFKDGVNLVNLVEILAKPAIPVRYNKRPRIKMQMVENIGIGLKMLADDGIKLVNIGNNDIHGGNMKLILGLVWTLILHYQISLDFQDQREDDKEDKEKEKGGSAKKQLQNWATDLINDLPSGKTVSNFTTDWNDGIALCSMVEAVAPGLCPEYGILDPVNKIENVQLGLDRAELGLGVGKIIEAEDLVNPNIDELSVLTYVSLLKNATPIIDIKPSDPQRVRVHGLESAIVGSPVFFYIDTSAAGLGKLDVEILDSEGQQVPFETFQKNSDIKIQCFPEISGQHEVHIEYNKKCIPGGDFSITISEFIEDVELHADETEGQPELLPEKNGAELDTELKAEPRPEGTGVSEETDENFELLTEEAWEDEAVIERILVAEDINADTAKDDDYDPASPLEHVLSEDSQRTFDCKPEQPVNIIRSEENIETKCESGSFDKKTSTDEFSEPTRVPEKCHSMNTIKSEPDPPEDIANTEEQTEVISNIKPLSHVISACFLVVSLALVASTGEENLPDRTEAALVSLFLAYLATFAAVDHEILTQGELAGWLKTSFNLAVCPILIAYLGCSIYSSELGPMEMTLGCLLLVELCVLKEHLDMRVIAKGVLVSLGGFVIVRCIGVSDVGQLEPIIE